MELRRLAVLMAFALLAVSQCTEARHSIQRRDADDINYDEQGDEASDDDTQNDTEVDNAGTVKPQIPAIILTKPTSFNVTAGDTIVLPCNVSPDATVAQWFKDDNSYFLGTMKTGTQDSRFSIASDSKDLVIEDVNVLDSGVYRCETVTTNTVAVNHSVIVLQAPKIISFVASDEGRVSEGSDLLLTCNVTGSPQPQIVWSKFTEGDGNDRLTEKDGEFSPNSVFIKNIKREQAGKYLCYAFNTIGHSQEAIDVVVFGKPRVHVHKTVVNSDINVEAVLQCSVHEELAPHIRWYKDGRLIEDSSSQFAISTNGAHSNLTVVPTADTDFGTFTCEAENAHGKHNKAIELVQSPVIEDLDVDGAKLAWTIHSYQPLEAIEVQLRDRNGDGDFRQLSVPVPDTKERRYEIAFILSDKQLDAGKYEVFVKAKNNNSWSRNTDPVTVDIEAQAQLIQHASVYRGSDSNAHSIRPTTTAVVSTILMYLLVRML